MAKKTKNNKIEGLGDVVKEVTNFLGIETCDDCEERRKKLNQMFPFTKRPSYIITDEEIIYLRNAKDINKVDTGILTTIYNKTYNTSVKPCNCPTLMKELLEKLLIQINYQEIK